MFGIYNCFLTLLICFIGSIVCSRENEILQIFPPIPVAVSKSANSVCKEESDRYMDNLKNFTLWAHEMWDATAKSAAGVLRGNVYQMGHFDQCLTAKAPFPTQYCLATITASIPKPKGRRDPLSLNFDPYKTVFQRLYKYDDQSQQSRNVIKVGWCVPSSCSTRDLEENLNEYLLNVDNKFQHQNVTYNAKFMEVLCHTKAESQYFDVADICFCFLVILLCTMVVAATIYDYSKLSQSKDKKLLKKPRSSKFIMAFSARKNFLELNRADESNPALSILYGMRTICIFLIIVDHRFGTFISSAILNFNFLEQQYRSSVACLLFHGDLFVDSFFILSGLLVVYSLLNQMDRHRLNPGFIILLRYIRLTPVYAFVIFYYATLFNHTGEGPLWKVVAGADSQDCRQNWWTNLLYINNYVNADNMCMTHSWYLPCDFHYFIIAIFMVIIIKKNKRFGLGALLALTVTSLVIPFAITLLYKRPGLMQFYPEFLTGPKTYLDFKLTYSKSHTRATPYFVGMFAGYIYYELKGSNKHVCRMKSFGILALSILFLIICVFSGKVFYDPYHIYNAVEAASYASFHRLAWGVGTVGILYIASFGHAAIIKTILSWKPWIPLSKLVYGAYLCHMSFQLRSAAKFMSPRQLTYFDVISLALSDIVLAFVTALVLYLLIEAPFRKVFREIMMPSKDKSPKPKNNNGERHNSVEENMIMSNNNVVNSRV
ncbi:nose resistant to fluoxetine protein 6-like isoform X1 [Diabrotica virgifera virgifera]|uniref:Nose resistant-to-fluoxetine protein N-terminal domain-containing protein n=1 Tax=Diabrotica virgifera virgifera TaxID=50390 RepID=A0ABM5JM51_DIAVI|nr:nose resistant to fluoxetine protein 6-like isoform X1 [Diabrotica virgifera virgifera]